MTTSGNPLAEQISKTLLPGMHLPAALVALFDWIEANGLVVDRNGVKVGSLFDHDQLKARWTDSSRPGGTEVEFAPQPGEVSVGTNSQKPAQRLRIFAQTGADGSSAAFWLDEQGTQHIVHLGSGSGSMLACVLASDPVDFIRLLAIGYDEICWPEQFNAAPNAPPCTFIVEPNRTFQEWVRRTFNVEIPTTASEIVKHPAEYGDRKVPDPFCRWLEEIDF